MQQINRVVFLLLVMAAATPSCKCFFGFVAKSSPLRRTSPTTQQPQLDLMLHNKNNVNNNCRQPHCSGIKNRRIICCSSNLRHGGEEEFHNQPTTNIQSFSKIFCKFAPLWTLLSAFIGVKESYVIAPTLGSLHMMQYALSTLMLAMGLTITPKDFREAAKPSF